MSDVISVPNPDLEVVEGNRARWSSADRRRWGWHNLHRIARYVIALRAARVMPLRKKMDLRIAEIDAVRHFTSLPWFSGMVVIRGSDVLFERYAADFGPERPHSIQSITKTIVNLLAGRLVDAGSLDLARKVAHYVPEIGSGYATATVQEVLNMDVANEYSEDFADPQAMYYRHEEAMGWRLPRRDGPEETEHGFLVRIASSSTLNVTGYAQYKDANTAVMGWIIERAGGRPLQSLLAEVVDAAGIEGSLYMTIDREGVPCLEGGGCLSARDLARYFALFVRGGRGIDGQRVGSLSFIESTLRAGVPRAGPYEWLRYSNHLMVRDRFVGHGGWGGQYAMANLDTGTIAVFFSVIESEHAITKEYLPAVIRMLEQVTGATEHP